MSDEPVLADGYLDAIWQNIHQHGVRYTSRTIGRLGPHGECWENAWRFVLDHDDLEYVEGLARTATGAEGHNWVIRPGIAYPHAWAVRRGEDRTAIECTSGWERCPDAEYVGVPIEREKARILDDLLKLRMPTASVLELAALGIRVTSRGIDLTP